VKPTAARELREDSEMTANAGSSADAPAPKRSRALRPRDAATLIILDRSEGEAKVLMGRRHHGHKFMPGKYVFPGGRVEPEDRRMCAAGALDADVEAKLNARVPRPSPGFARAIALAAIRETFEETGLAVGVADTGAPEKPPPGAWTRFAATGVCPALDDIDFLARAITPPGRPRRFDARFFIVEASAVAARVEGVVHPEAELVDLVWTPLAKARELDLPRITHLALEDLAQALKDGLDRKRPRPFYRELRGKRLREEL
jgi:8-oxo-dGTP pyrophosphatase MutT (NUDIX family)